MFVKSFGRFAAKEQGLRSCVYQSQHHATYGLPKIHSRNKFLESLEGRIDASTIKGSIERCCRKMRTLMKIDIYYQYAYGSRLTELLKAPHSVLITIWPSWAIVGVPANLDILAIKGYELRRCARTQMKWYQCLQCRLHWFLSQKLHQQCSLLRCTSETGAFRQSIEWQDINTTFSENQNRDLHRWQVRHISHPYVSYQRHPVKV